MMNMLRRATALGVALGLCLPVAAPAVEGDPPIPACRKQFSPPSMFGPLELGSKKVKGVKSSGAWRVGYDWNDEPSVKQLELRRYKGTLPYGLNRGDSIKTVRRKLAAHFPATSMVKSEDTWAWHDRVVTSFCKNSIGIEQRFEVAFRKGVMFALIVASGTDTYERDY